MEYLTLTGIITYFYKKKRFSQRVNELQQFDIQRIILDCNNERYTISFLAKYNNLLKKCRIGSEVKITVKTKGNVWMYENETFSSNEFHCKTLEIIRSTNIDYPINYKNQLYQIHRFYIDNNLQLKLINKNTKEELIVSLNHTFPNRELNKNTILFDNKIDNKLLEHLEINGILSISSNIVSDGKNGWICKILVLDFLSKLDLDKKIETFLNKEYDKFNSIYYYIRVIKSKPVEQLNFTHYNENLDINEQNMMFWNQNVN